MSASQTNYGIPASGTTTNASTQTLHAETIGENRSGVMAVKVVARRVSDGATKIFDYVLGFKRGTGSLEVFGLSLLATLGTVGDLVALSLATATVDASSEDMRIRVTGLASTEIDWSAVLIGISADHS